MPGLKGHHIAQMVNAIVAKVDDRWNMPPVFRHFITEAVCEYLDNNRLRLDRERAMTGTMEDCLSPCQLADNLMAYNEWRKGNADGLEFSQKRITETLDQSIKYLDAMDIEQDNHK